MATTNHAVGLLCRRAVWGLHLINSAVCGGCATNSMIPWLISTFAVSFLLVDDDKTVLDVLLACFVAVFHTFDAVLHRT
jgi:hypothetical protein